MLASYVLNYNRACELALRYPRAALYSAHMALGAATAIGRTDLASGVREFIVALTAPRS